MKTKILIASLALTASAHVFSGDKEGTYSGGDIIQITSFRTATTAEPITTIITQGSDIEVSFNSNVGVVKTTIKNRSGQMFYQQSVDTSVESSLQINIANYPKGKYTIVFTDAQGIIIQTEQFTVD